MARTRSPEKKEAILDAVAPLVESEGYNKTGIEHIAAAAGVGKQTIYRWWPTKPDLMAEAYTRLVPSHELASGAEDPRDALAEILRNSFRIFRKTPAPRILAGLIADAQSEPAAAEALYNNLLVGRRGVITAPFRRGVESGMLPEDFDMDAAADQLVAAVWYKLLTDPQALTDAFARQVVDRILPRDAKGKLVMRDYFPGALGEVCALQSRYYAEGWGFGRAFELDRAEEMAEFLGRFDHQRDLFKLVCRDGRVVAAVAVDGGAEEAAGGGSLLRWFIVDGAEQGNGIGRQLLSIAVEHARAQGYRSIALHTFEGLETARYLYEEAGFKLANEEMSDKWGAVTLQQVFVLDLTE